MGKQQHAHAVQQLRSATLRRFGHTWERDDDTWSAEVSGRFRVTTWPFGSIHQSKVYVRCAHAHPSDCGEVGIGLTPCRSRDAAMQQGLAWAKRYERTGPPSPRAVFLDCYREYPDLFRTRADVIDQLFFTIGNGYDWLDGAIVPTIIESRGHRERSLREVRRQAARSRQRLLTTIERVVAKERRHKTRATLRELLRKLERRDEPGTRESRRRPLADDGNPRKFYPVSRGYSEITYVPDDVRPDWLAVAYEAAKLLRDRSGIPSGACVDARERKEQRANRTIGREICRELERRFPTLRTAV